MEKRNYQKEMEQILRSLEGEAPTGLLLHSCCGPCSSYILEYLAPYFRIELFFDNPNIQPFSEYQHRLAEQRRVMAQVDAPHGLYLHEGVYEPKRYFEAVKGLEHLGEGSERCFACYHFRMKEAARQGVQLNCQYYATTLSISPYKNVEKINAIGEAIAQEVGIHHLPNDFKKRGGYQRSIALCKDWDIYRQDYCGCVFSEKEMAIHREEAAKKANL